MYFERNAWMKVILVVLISCIHLASFENVTGRCSDNGKLEDGICVCNTGFSGKSCESCTGRFFITDEKGTISNGPKTGSSLHISNCLGILHPLVGENETLFVEFADAPGSCENDTLVVYDGTSIYSPILATFNGATSTQIGINLTGKQYSQSGYLLFDFASAGQELYNTGYTINYKVEKNCNETCLGPLARTGIPNVNSEYDGNGVKVYSWNDMISQSRASYASAVNDKYTYVFDGVSYGQSEFYERFIRLNRDDLKWETVTSTTTPQARSFHSLVYHKDANQFFMYGGQLEDGTITNELWRFHSDTWHLANVLMADGDIPPLMGHTAHMIESSKGLVDMWVFFGYHPQWKCSDQLFILKDGSLAWEKVNQTGYRPSGSFGHASALDKDNGLVYVHGGHGLNQLAAFDTTTYRWTVFPSSPTATYLHSISLVNGNLFVIGGKMCDTDECICDESIPLRYNIDLQVWQEISNPKLKSASQRYGHASLFGDEKSDRVLLFGGFSNVMHSDVIEYTPKASVNCSVFNQTSCEHSIDCYWTGICKHNNLPNCEAICDEIESCDRCLASSCSCCYDSVWHKCTRPSARSTCNVTDICRPRIEEDFCLSHHDCYSCFEDGCTWQEEMVHGLWTCIPYIDGTFPDAVCEATCTQQMDCESCTSLGECLWCGASQSCVPEALTYVHDPYFKCANNFQQDCVILNNTNEVCSEFQSCESCFTNSACGWCMKDQLTGTGECVVGNATGSQFCNQSSWRFTECPDCQCNGHSNCSSGDSDSDCGTCDVGYTGEKCGKCEPLYYGNALNGKECKACECNDHATNCTSFGTCECNVFGMTGKHCDGCNMEAGFFGDSVNDTCFYKMKTNQEYVFKDSVMHVPNLGFDICLEKNDDITFTVRVRNSHPASLFVEVNSTSALDNVTSGIFSVNMTVSFKVTSATLFKSYGKTCIRLQFRNLTGATYVSVSVTQSNYLILKVILSLSIGAIFLLLIGLAAYKLRQRNELRQLLEFQFEEEERRANRPISYVNLCVDDCKIVPGDENVTIIGQEVLDSRKRSFCSVFLVLPEQNSKEKSHGLAIGSAFVKCDPKLLEEEDQVRVEEEHLEVPSKSSVFSPFVKIFSRSPAPGPSTVVVTHVEPPNPNRSNYSFENPVLQLENEEEETDNNRQL